MDPGAWGRRHYAPNGVSFLSTRVARCLREQTQGQSRALFEAGSAHETLSADTRWPLHERVELGEVGLVRRSLPARASPGARGRGVRTQPQDEQPRRSLATKGMLTEGLLVFPETFRGRQATVDTSRSLSLPNP